MSKTALLAALKDLDLARITQLLTAAPHLRGLRNEKGFDLLQMCCSRSTVGDAAAAARQVRMAEYLVDSGFDPLVIHTTAPGEDGEADPARLSLVFFAVARAQNNRLARYFLERGAAPGAVFAAVWWGNADILPDLVERGADVNEIVGATPLHMAVTIFERGAENRPALARRRREVVRELLRLGADPNLAAFDRTTPLHTALDRGNLEVFTLLLQQGADPDRAGKDGRTVREIAARKKDKRFAAALERQAGRRGGPRSPATSDARRRSAPRRPL